MNHPVITFQNGTRQITLKADLTASDVHSAMAAIAEEMNRRDIPREQRFGLFGEAGIGWPGTQFGIRWAHDDRLTREMLVGWYRPAIVPPALLLQPDAVVWCLIRAEG